MSWSKFYYLLLLSVLILSLAVHALKIGPTGNSFEYAPGQEFMFYPYLVNDYSSDNQFSISLEGELANYSSLPENTTLVTVKAGETYHFPVSVKIPAEGLPPGTKELYVSVAEVPKKGYGQSTVSALVKQRLLIKTHIPYPHKYLELGTFDVPQNNQLGQTIYFSLKILGLGKEPINEVQGDIDISGAEGGNISVPLTSVHNLQALQDDQMLAEWTPLAGQVNLGQYIAIVHVTYDNSGINLSRKRVFSLGDPLIEILSLNQSRIPIQQLTENHITLKSSWNEELNYYALISLLYNGTEKASYKTATETLPGWNTQSSKFYLNTVDLPIGDYSLNVTVYYDTKVAQKIFPVSLINESVLPSPSSLGSGVLSLVLMSIIILVVGIYFYISSRRKEDF